MINYSLKGIKWTDDPITLSLAAFSYSSDSAVPFTAAIAAPYQQTVAMAMMAWDSVAAVTFQQIPDNANPGLAADIRVGFADIANGSEIGLTAYQFSGGNFLRDVSVFLRDPAVDPLVQSGGGTFTYQGTSTQLYQLVLHEIGHALGLNHSTDPNSVMYPILGPQNRTFDASDIAGIQAIYGADAAITPETLGVPVFRFFNPKSGAHFFTASRAESGHLQSADQNWKLEFIGFNAVNPARSDPDAAPVYRFFDAKNGDHFYTINQNEAGQILNTMPEMKPEGIAFNEDATARPGDTAVYRFYNPGTGQHFYTASVGEKDALLASRSGQTSEGIAFYAPT